MSLFGLDKAEARWFVSLLTRLSELSEYDVDEFQADGALKDFWRYHPIDWGKKNVPIKRTDCNWIEKTYLNNEEDYPFVQLTVSKARGRFVGFFDEGGVFHIVLLDYHHNIQPSKDVAYRVTPCEPLGCEWSFVMLSIGKLKDSAKCSPTCEAAAGLRDLHHEQSLPLAVLIGLSEDDHKIALELVEGSKATSMAAIFEHGLTSLYAGDAAAPETLKECVPGTVAASCA